VPAAAIPSAPFKKLFLFMFVPLDETSIIDRVLPGKMFFPAPAIRSPPTDLT